MNRRNLLTVLALAPIGFVLRTPRSVGKQDPIEAFRELYGSLSSIDLVFTSQRLSGRLRAAQGGKYHIEAADRLFISNGTAVWNVQSSTKTVVIDRYVPTDELSVDRIFFVLLNVYVPSVLSKGKKTILRLSPPGNDAMIIGVDHADVHLDSKMSITQIDVSERGVTTSWTITKLKRNPALPASIFAFTAPSGWNTVDLR